MKDRGALREAGKTIRLQLGIENNEETNLAPGFGPLADEIVFGKLWSRPGLSIDNRMLATLSALTSLQRLPQLETYIGSALKIGMTPSMIQEVVIHCGMYSGFPTMENSLAVVSAVLTKRNIPTPNVELPEMNLNELEEMGQKTKRSLHAERAEEGYAAPGDQASAELYAVAIQYLYGEVWNRPGISQRQRMICSVAAFTAINAEKQQRKFFRSALNVGLTRQEIVEVIMQTGPYAGFPGALNALVIADDVLN